MLLEAFFKLKKMASIETVLNGDEAYITVYLPFKFTDKRAYHKILNDASKLTSYCNLKNGNLTVEKKYEMIDNPIFKCEHCEKVFKRVNGLTSHLKTCKLKNKLP